MENNKDDSKRSYVCKLCKKDYSSYKTLWTHNSKFHKDENKIISSNYQELSSNCQVLSSDDKIYNCRYCNKEYNLIQSRWFHELKCKKEYEIENAKLQELKLEEIKLEQMKAETNKIKEETNKINAENKNLELQIKMVKLNNNTAGKIITKNSNNTNNGTIAGTINNTFVKYNNICYNNVLTKKDMKEIVSDFETALEKAIQKFHFNEKFPENNNIFITNLRDKLMYVFDGIQFMAIDKKEAIYELMDCHACEIYNYVKKDKILLERYNKLMFDIFKSTKKYVDENNQVFKNYNDYKTDKIKKLIYNSSNKKKFEEIKSMDKLFEKLDNDVII